MRKPLQELTEQKQSKVFILWRETVYHTADQMFNYSLRSIVVPVKTQKTKDAAELSGAGYKNQCSQHSARLCLTNITRMLMVTATVQ